MASSKRILISGAGVAGPALAILLTRTGHKCTIVERSANIRTAGQQIDVSGEGLKVVRVLGIEEAIRAATVKDEGAKFVTEDGQLIASFPAEKEAGDGTLSPVREIEIMRGDFVRVLYEPTIESVEYILGDQISAIRQHDSGVTVNLVKNGEREFDLVVAADGLRSRTRNLVFDKDNSEMVSFNQIIAFFNIPWKESDGTWTRVYNVPNGRVVTLRPNIRDKTTGAYLTQMTKDSARVATMSLDEQKAEMESVFTGAGYESERILKDLRENVSDFYLQETAQVKSKSYVKDRVVLLGDAGYAPSPISGQGTTLALIGAYILAGCINTYPDHKEALAEYEKQMRPFVENSQKLPPGAPDVVIPFSTFGISILRALIGTAGVIVNSGIAKAVTTVLKPLLALRGKKLELPEYPSLSTRESDASTT